MPSDTFQTYAINWDTAAGKRLDLLARLLPPEPVQHIVVFGSAPLQMQLAPDFLSGDVNIFPFSESDLQIFVAQNGLEASEENFGFQVTDPYAFRATTNWRGQATEVEHHGHTYIIPHPWDILVGKLQRLEEKDLEAFRLVIRLTGGPTAAEFARYLQGAVDHFRPRFDEEKSGDLLLNTQLLWETIYRSTIDVRAKIIRPAIERIRLGYEAQNRGDASLKTRLADLSTDKK